MTKIKHKGLELDTGREIEGWYVEEHGYVMIEGVPDLNQPTIRHYLYQDGIRLEVAETTLEPVLEDNTLEGLVINHVNNNTKEPEWFMYDLLKGLDMTVTVSYKDEDVMAENTDIEDVFFACEGDRLIIAVTAETPL